MRWSELRGVLAVVAVVVAIVVSWRTIEARPITTGAVDSPSTTTTVPDASTSTTSPAISPAATCARAAQFVAESALVPRDAGPGPLAGLALSFWRDLSQTAPLDLRQELPAVVDYYTAYLETAGPFDFDTTDIILEGDKERLQQLITRPAPGLGPARESVVALCGFEVPDQPWMGAEAFEELEDRLLDPPDEDDDDA